MMIGLVQTCGQHSNRRQHGTGNAQIYMLMQHSTDTLSIKSPSPSGAPLQGHVGTGFDIPDTVSNEGEIWKALGKM